MISVSSIRGGNPSAKEAPHQFASEWSLCTSCNAFTCDRCLARDGGKCACGAPGRLRSEDERIAIALQMMGMGPKPPGPTPPGAIATTRITGPGEARRGSADRSDGSSLAIGMAAAGVSIGAISGWFAMGTIGAVVAAALGGAVGYALGAERR